MNKLQWNFNQNAVVFFKENACEILSYEKYELFCSGLIVLSHIDITSQGAVLNKILEYCIAFHSFSL